MPNTTPNIGLIKPNGNEKVDISQLNANADVIDKTCGDLQELTQDVGKTPHLIQEHYNREDGNIYVSLYGNAVGKFWLFADFGAAGNQCIEGVYSDAIEQTNYQVPAELSGTKISNCWVINADATVGGSAALIIARRSIVVVVKTPYRKSQDMGVPFDIPTTDGIYKLQVLGGELSWILDEPAEETTE